MEMKRILEPKPLIENNHHTINSFLFINNSRVRQYYEVERKVHTIRALAPTATHENTSTVIQ